MAFVVGGGLDVPVEREFDFSKKGVVDAYQYLSERRTCRKGGDCDQEVVNRKGMVAYALHWKPFSIPFSAPCANIPSS